MWIFTYTLSTLPKTWKRFLFGKKSCFCATHKQGLPEKEHSLNPENWPLIMKKGFAHK